MPRLNLFRKPPTLQTYITIVSGLSRSGTSMMMQMLEAGGIRPATDHVRPKKHNDRRLKQLYTSDLAKTRSWLLQQKHIDLLYVDYADIVDRPKGPLRIIAGFLGLKLNTKRISSIIDQSMRHHNVNGAPDS
ncbi:MAG: hypothetical protein ACI9SP_004303 [Arenicella sp.]|jgi:hypothetical protein